MGPQDYIQFGALGLLGAVLFWLARVLPVLAKSFTKAISDLTKEVESFRKQQSRFATLLTLLLSREFGEEETLEMLEREDERREHSPRSRQDHVS